jgi:hypothetical protein
MQIVVNPALHVCVRALDGSNRQSTGSVLACSGRRMTIATDLGVQVGTALKIQSDDYVVLGELMAVDAPGSFSLQIRHILRIEDINYIQERWF